MGGSRKIFWEATHIWNGYSEHKVIHDQLNTLLEL